MAVKGSGGDLRSMGTSGFAVLYLEQLERLIPRYRGEAHEDEMVGFYPLCAFGENRVAASIDTPLHAFLPFDHVDHLHPDWAIALAASANGREKLDEFNRRYGRRIIWVPWQRPGFELALMLKAAVAEHPGCDGLVLGSHGLFTWGSTQRDCYRNSIKTIDQMGEFIDEHARRQRARFGGTAVAHAVGSRSGGRRHPAPLARRRVIRPARDRARRALGRGTRVCQLRVGGGSLRARDELPGSFPADAHLADVRAVEPGRGNGGGSDRAHRRAPHRISRALRRLLHRPRRRRFAADARLESVGGRDSGARHFRVCKDKREARITTEFFVNAIHVMAGATALEDDRHPSTTLPQARRPEQAREFTSFHNYVALPRAEAFGIEYWALEEAKLQRMPAEREFSRTIALVVGGGSGIGREVALELARRGSHVVVADQHLAAADATWTDAQALSSTEMGMAARLDLTDRTSIAAAFRAMVLRSAAPTSSSTPRRSIRRPSRGRRRRNRPGLERCRSTSPATTCWLRRHDACSPHRSCQRRSS